ncbi:MAG: HK97 family phage prohead protease [Bauldia sp.]|nr:HK97 family phage prohead protease [Bauldia sp.]
MRKPEPKSIADAIELRAPEVHASDRGETLTKIFRAPASWNQESRSARFVMSSQNPDRPWGDVVVTDGIDTTDFEKNPVALLFHASRNFPVGQWSDLQKMATSRPPRLEGTITLMPEGELEEADKAAALVRNGIMRACSIGFLPVEMELIRDDDDNWTGGIKWVESELLECSLVPIPAQPRALVKAAEGDVDAAKRALEAQIDLWFKGLDDLGFSREDYIGALRGVVGEKKLIVPNPTPPVVETADSIVAELKAPENKGLLARLKTLFASEAGAERTEPVVDTPESQAKLVEGSLAAAQARSAAARERLARHL